MIQTLQFKDLKSLNEFLSVLPDADVKTISSTDTGFTVTYRTKDPAIQQEAVDKLTNK